MKLYMCDREPNQEQSVFAERYIIGRVGSYRIKV